MTDAFGRLHRYVSSGLETQGWRHEGIHQHNYYYPERKVKTGEVAVPLWERQARPARTKQLLAIAPSLSPRTSSAAQRSSLRHY